MITLRVATAETIRLGETIKQRVYVSTKYEYLIGHDSGTGVINTPIADNAWGKKGGVLSKILRGERV